MTPIHPIEQRIVDFFKAGDAEAMDLLYTHYADALYGIVARMINDPLAAEDVLQEALVKVWRNSATYDPTKGRLFTWLARIVRNQAIDAIRKQDRSGEIHGGTIDVLMEVTPDEAPDMSTRHDLSKVLSALDEQERALLEHSYILGYSHPEIADKFDMPIGTVKTRIRKAMISLRSIFGNGH